MNILNLRGEPALQAAEPDPAVIALLEELLEKARSGAIQGIGTVQIDPSRLCSYSSAGLLGSFGLLGAAVHLTEVLRHASESR